MPGGSNDVRTGRRPVRRYGGPLLSLILAGALGASCVAAPESDGSAGRPGETPAGRRAGDERRAEVVFPRGRMVVAEIADTPAKLQRGYMFREHVAENEGMVFVFPEPGVHPFWMKNTKVALDIIWIDREMSIIHIESSVPPCVDDPCPSYGPVRKVSYVLEVRGGTAAHDRLAIGDRLAITFPPSQ